MTPEKLSIYFDTSPAIGLLKADHSPFVVCFLYERFKRAHVIDIPHSDLLSTLAAYQERLHESGHNALRDRPEDLLRIWSSSDKRWLRRHLEVGRTEALYQLTPHSEAVIEFVSQALQQDLTFVGTESRLRLVMQTLEELSIKASDDPQVRLKYLRDQQAHVTAEIEEIEQGGQLKTLAPTRIREQFALAVQLLRELQGDFRAVEDKFKEITRHVQQRQVQGLDARGGILGDALGAEDALKSQDQGVSFFEFLKFIQSPQQQDRLREVIRQLLHMRELADQTTGLETIRHMVRGLLDEAEKVLQTTRRLSASLRRLLDTRTQQERRRVTNLLHQIRIFAAKMCDHPPRHFGFEIEGAIEISAPMSRTDWSPPLKFEQLDLSEHVIDEELRRNLFRQFQQLRPIDWNAMRRRIRQALQPSGHCTLGKLLDDEPPEGLIDVLGYLQIACDDGHQVRADATEHVILPDGDLGLMKLTIPLVTFVAGDNDGR
jgi:hypothetical protein